MDPIKTEIVVVGGGPGGYAAAFYAADQGKKVILVEREKRLGGVCLNRGCIPSKALLHATELLAEARESALRGIRFAAPQIDLATLRAWKDAILTRMSQGVASIAQKRGVQVMHGRGHFEDSHTLRVETDDGQGFIQFDKAIIAVGSKPAVPKAFDLGNPRIMTSTEALEIEDVPPELLVIGGGYIGMELGTVYARLGSRVTVIEALDSILSGADPDLARPVARFAEKNFKQVRLKTKVARMATAAKQIKVTVDDGSGATTDELYDRVLVSVGRVPNSEDLGLENTRVERDDKGFVKVNEKLETSDPNLCAIGDIAGGVMLAHKAAKEARICVEAICGMASRWDNVVVPAVVFTDPELAWCGLTEAEAAATGRKVDVARFPWGASGRAQTFDRTDGLTKLIVDPETERVLGVGIVGHGAGELISEGVLAIEMGATVRDIAETVHPHPTLSETIMEAAEVFFGHSSHTYVRKRPAAERPVA